MNRITRLVLSGGSAALLTGTIMLGSATTALASGPSCAQLERDYNHAVHQADVYWRLGDDFGSSGDYHQAEYWFRQYRYQWLNISNMQLC